MFGLWDIGHREYLLQMGGGGSFEKIAFYNDFFSTISVFILLSVIIQNLLYFSPVFDNTQDSVHGKRGCRNDSPGSWFNFSFVLQGLLWDH